MPTTKSRYVLYVAIVFTFVLTCVTCFIFIKTRNVIDLTSVAASLLVLFACVGGLIVESKTTTPSNSTPDQKRPARWNLPKHRVDDGDKMPPVGARADEEIWTMAKLTPKQEEFISLLNADKLTEEAAGLTYNYAYNEIKGRYDSGESVLAKSPKFAFYYARDVLKGRFAQGEAAIATEAHYAYLYAFFIFKGPFKQGEDAIAKSPEHSYLYAIHVLKGRFEKGEAAIAKEHECNITDYANMLIRNKLISLTTAYDLCLHNPSLRPIFEHVVAQDAYTSYCYARDVLKGRFELGEDAIAKGCPVYSYEYAKIIKGRFEKGEASIAQDGMYACLYANNILQERFEQGEAAIAKEGYMSNYYFKPTDAKVTYPRKEFL